MSTTSGLQTSAAPTQRTKQRPRRHLLRNIHLWLGIGLFVLLMPIALSGAVLVYHDDIDEFMHTPRAAVTPAMPTDLSLAAGNARKAAGDGFTPMSISIPDDARTPLTIALRSAGRQSGPPARLVAYVDRGDAHVLSVVDFRNTFFGFMHIFHENLTIPFYYGRDIVGWIGVAMLTLSLTGLYLWWPRRGQWSRAFAWRRSPATSSNLHYLTGFWICFPLALISLTGIYRAWPQQGRALLTSMSLPTTQPQRGQPLPNPERSPAEIYAIAAKQPNARVTAITYPTAPSGAWRVQLRKEGHAEPVSLLVNDRSGAVTTAEPPSGDRVAFWIRSLHEGSNAGEVWRLIAFVTGLMPAILGVTGILVWLRQRRQRAMMTGSPHAPGKKPLGVGEAAPAE